MKITLLLFMFWCSRHNLAVCEKAQSMTYTKYGEFVMRPIC